MGSRNLISWSQSTINSDSFWPSNSGNVDSPERPRGIPGASESPNEYPLSYQHLLDEYLLDEKITVGSYSYEDSTKVFSASSTNLSEPGTKLSRSQAVTPTISSNGGGDEWGSILETSQNVAAMEIILGDLVTERPCSRPTSDDVDKVLAPGGEQIPAGHDRSRTYGPGTMTPRPDAPDPSLKIPFRKDKDHSTMYASDLRATNTLGISFTENPASGLLARRGGFPAICSGANTIKLDSAGYRWDSSRVSTNCDQASDRGERVDAPYSSSLGNIASPGPTNYDCHFLNQDSTSKVGDSPVKRGRKDNSQQERSLVSGRGHEDTSNSPVKTSELLDWRGPPLRVTPKSLSNLQSAAWDSANRDGKRLLGSLSRPYDGADWRAMSKSARDLPPHMHVPNQSSQASSGFNHPARMAAMAKPAPPSALTSSSISESTLQPSRTQMVFANGRPQPGMWDQAPVEISQTIDLPNNGVRRGNERGGRITRGFNLPPHLPPQNMHSRSVPLRASHSYRNSTEFCETDERTNSMSNSVVIIADDSASERPGLHSIPMNRRPSSGLPLSRSTEGNASLLHTMDRPGVAATDLESVTASVQVKGESDEDAVSPANDQDVDRSWPNSISTRPTTKKSASTSFKGRRKGNPIQHRPDPNSPVPQDIWSSLPVTEDLAEPRTDTYESLASRYAGERKNASVSDGVMGKRDSKIAVRQSSPTDVGGTRDRVNQRLPATKQNHPGRRNVSPKAHRGTASFVAPHGVGGAYCNESSSSPDNAYNILESSKPPLDIPMGDIWSTCPAVDLISLDGEEGMDVQGDFTTPDLSQHAFTKEEQVQPLQSPTDLVPGHASPSSTSTGATSTQPLGAGIHNATNLAELCGLFEIAPFQAE